MNSTTSYASDPAKFETVLNAFLDAINRATVAYYKSNGFTHQLPDEVRVENLGRKFARICKFEDRGGKRVCGAVHCFVNLENGDVHKAATWKAAETTGKTKGVRTNIFADDVLDHVTPHGTSYLRGGCFDTVAGYLKAAV